jgi:hypothetical protein
MKRLVADGRRESIGRSDIGLEQLKEIVTIARLKPAVVRRVCLDSFLGPTEPDDVSVRVLSGMLRGHH